MTGMPCGPVTVLVVPPASTTCSSAFGRAPRRAGRRPGRPGGGDDRRTGRSSWSPSTASARSAPPSVLLSPAWKAREVGPRARAHGPGPRRGRRAVDRVAGRAASARAGSPTSTVRRHEAPPAARPNQSEAGAASDTDEAVLVFSSGTTGLPKAVRHTHRSMGMCHRALVPDARPRPDRPIPGGHAAFAHPRPVEPPGGHAAGCHRAPAPPVRPRRGAPFHRGRTG